MAFLCVRVLTHLLVLLSCTALYLVDILELDLKQMDLKEFEESEAFLSCCSFEDSSFDWPFSMVLLAFSSLSVRLHSFSWRLDASLNLSCLL